MENFLVEDFSFGWITYNLLYFFFIYLIFHKIKESQNYLLNIVTCTVILLIALFGNAITPDFNSYISLVKDIKNTLHPEKINDIEPVYKYIIHHFANSHFLFQTIIFISQIILFFIIISSLKYHNLPIFYLFFITLCLYWGFISGRSSLYIYFYIFGLFLFAFYKQRLLGLGFIFISMFLHKSAFYFIPLISLLLFLPIHKILNNKLLIIIFFIIFTLFLILIKNLLSQIFDNIITIDGFEGEGYIRRQYSLHEGKSLIWDLIFKIQISIFIFSVFILLYKYKYIYNRFNQFLKIMYKLLFWISTLTIFYFLLDLPDDTIGTRLLTIAYLPFCIFISSKEIYKTITKRNLYLICILTFIYMLCTNLYILGVARTTYKFFI